MRFPVLTRILAGLALAVSLGAAVPAQDALDRASAIVVGGGQPFGLYYPAAGAVCYLYGRTGTTSRCLVDTYADSGEALQALSDGSVDFAVVQSDWQQHAVKGTSRFRADGPDQGLRAVFSLHGEAVTLVVRRAAGIRAVPDLMDKQVDFGPDETYRSLFMDMILAAEGLERDDLAGSSGLSLAAGLAKLCEGTLDAVSIVAAHANGAVAEAMARCDLEILALTGPAIDKLLRAGRGLSAITIPAGLYQGQDREVRTFGLRATLVTRDSQPKDVVARIATSTMEGLSWLRGRHPAFASLEPKTMAVSGLSAPLHEGAAEVYREKGLR